MHITCCCRGLNCFGPNINIFRDPRWGRGSETYGEDPHLTSRMGVHFVRGIQGSDKSYIKVGSLALRLLCFKSCLYKLCQIVSHPPAVLDVSIRAVTCSLRAVVCIHRAFFVCVLIGLLRCMKGLCHTCVRLH